MLCSAADVADVANVDVDVTYANATSDVNDAALNANDATPNSNDPTSGHVRPSSHGYDAATALAEIRLP